MPVTEQRAVLIDHKLKFHLHADRLVLSTEDGSLSSVLPAKLISRGAEQKLQLSPSEHTDQAAPDPVLLKLIAQAHAAQRMVLGGSGEPTVASYSKRHLWQLIRISWLAPDITTAIVEGRHPVGLTGRRLLRASALPLDWVEQRKFLGFS